MRNCLALLGAWAINARTKARDPHPHVFRQTGFQSTYLVFARVGLHARAVVVHAAGIAHTDTVLAVGVGLANLEICFPRVCA